MAKKTKDKPQRGLQDDTSDTQERCIAAQKAAHLDLMLGQIANYCPVISRNTIVNKTDVGTPKNPRPP